ncbi:MAG TPA: hypothetical protein PK095_24715, partial [Myxococcota bacterium]|nr:hypothetical protein [Myxococcota bacterium]
LVPTPEDGMSLPIRQSWLTNLEVETRVADTSAPPGEVLFIGIFSREAISVTAMRRALDTLPATGPDLDSGAAMVENHLRSSLALGPFDLVQIATTRIVAASAPHPHPPTDGAPTDTRQEAP